jgi:multiple sugar transport system ATP-binding protein
VASVTYDHVSKRFGDVAAIDDLNIHVEDKAFLVLVGPSGCGKTTALRLLAGLEEITEGKILIDDRMVNDVAPKDRDIAMVFQSYALYPHMSVFDNMAFGLRLRNVPKADIQKRVKQAADILGIESFLDRKPRQLSGGQRQRVALGRAIVREPKVFLLDEPLSNLDAKLRVQTRAEISKLHQRLAATFIYVTHDQTEAMTMANRIAVIKGGRLQQLDTPQHLYDFPVNVFVAGFIGSPAMNFFNATLARSDGAVVADAGAFQVRTPASRREAYDKHVGRKVILGIRPEDIHDPALAPTQVVGAPVGAKVDVTELMGNEVFVYLKTGDTSYVARVDPRTSFRMGADVQVSFNTDNVHLFEVEGDQLAIR